MNESSSSEPKQTEAKQTALQWAKLHIADHARLMMDNQRTLNMSAESDKNYRDFVSRQREHIAKRKDQVSGEPVSSKNAEDPMEVKIDSPTISHTHYHNAPPAIPAPQSTSPLAKAAVAGIAAAALGAGLGLPLAYVLSQRDEPAPIVQPLEDTDTNYDLRIYRGDDKQEASDYRRPEPVE